MLAAVAALIGVILGAVLGPLSSYFLTERTNRTALDRDRLKYFYAPLDSLLRVNGALYEETRLAIQDLENDSEAARVWGMVAQDVIIPNNRHILNILTQYIHLLDPSDEVHVYYQLATHCHMYELFQRSPFVGYAAFQFPSKLPDHVTNTRNTIARRLGIV